MKFERVAVVDGKARQAAEPGVEGAAVEDGTLRPAYPAMKTVTQLRKVGGTIAVYGYRETPSPNATPEQADRQLRVAHIVNPGSYTVPQVLHPGLMASGADGLAHGRALCGLPVVTNGFASDHTPPEWELCRVCAKTN